MFDSFDPRWSDARDRNADRELDRDIYRDTPERSDDPRDAQIGWEAGIRTRSEAFF